MKEGMPAHLRRLCDLLGWLQREKAEAKVTWRGQPVGTWDSIRPRWKVAGGRLRIRFVASGHDPEYRVSAARPSVRGVDLLLEIPGRRASEPLSIAWLEEADRVPGSEAFRELASSVVGWARQTFPGCRVVSLARRPDRARTLSGSFLRILLRHLNRSLFVLVVPARDPADTTNSALTQALLWVARLRIRSPQIPLVYLLVPSGSSGILCHRSGFLDRDKVKASIWEYDADTAGQLQVRRAGNPSPPTEDRDFRWPVLGPFRWSAPLEQVLEFAPSYIRRYPRFKDYDSLRLWGLEFARVLGAGRDRLQFGVGSPQIELTDDNFDGLRHLIDEILYYRRPDSPDTQHPYYRMQAERWLECLILDEIPRLFPELLPESVYPQIPVYLGKEPGRVDILGADRQGRLVVMELKVTQDPDLPLQALDYWGRVIHHNENGDFERRGYFSGIRLERRPPRIYLVSPVFSFHDTTETVLAYVDPEIEVWKVAVNEDWRSGVKLLRRIRLRCNR